MRIGELARNAGVTVHTLRFYEARGLLPAAPRGPSNYREFPQTSVDRLKFIQEAQRLGFTLAEIRELLDVRVWSPSCEGLRARAERKLRDVEEQIRRLRAITTSLRRLLRSCEAARSNTCAVAQALQTVRW